MVLRIARYFNKVWVINPFCLDYEQLKPLLSREIWDEDKCVVRYATKFLWGRSLEIMDLHHPYNHEIMIHYGCPSSYGRQKQVEWLVKHDYPFEVI